MATTVLVTAPTGNIGSQIVRLLLARGGTSVRVLARDPGKLPADVRARADVRPGSHLDAATARDAAAGADVVFWLTPPAIVDDQAAYHARAADVATAAARAAGRVVNLSSEYADQPGMGLITHLGSIEPAVAATAVDVVHLRPGNFMENFLAQLDGIRGGAYALPVPATASTAFVATADIAAAAADWLTRTDWTGRHVHGVAGPERLSYARAVEVIADELVRPVKYVEVPPAAFRSKLLADGLPPGFVDGYAEMMAGLTARWAADRDLGYPMTVGRTDLRQFARHVIVPAAKGA